MIVSWQLGILWLCIPFPEYVERTCKEEYVQKHISSIYCHCFDLLAIGLLWILGFRIRSPTLYFSFIVYPRMDCCYGKFICSDSNIWMLSGTFSSTQYTSMNFFETSCGNLIFIFSAGRGKGKWLVDLLDLEPLVSSKQAYVGLQYIWQMMQARNSISKGIWTKIVSCQE